MIDGGADAPDPGRGLTIGELARRTGLQPAQLRMWELRHGFPQPHRLASGHRRYRESDVDLVRDVLRRKAAGVRLEAAIADTASVQPPDHLSIFATLRADHPDLPVHRLHKTTLIAMSQAIEDECLAAADSPVLFGAFQRSAFFAPSAPRWAELARVARAALVFAQDWPDTGGAHHPHRATADGPERVTLAGTAPLLREWAVICDAQGSTACLSAWELPDQAGVPDRQRLFEAVWSVDAAAVRRASLMAAHTAAHAGSATAERLVQELADAPTASGVSAETVNRLLNRVVAYVDRLAVG